MPSNTPRSPEGERASSGAEGRLVGYAMKPCCGYCAEERQTREGMPFCDCRLVDRICERHTPPVAAEAQGGADVNHACPVHGWEHDYRCCPLSDTAAVERFVAEVRERREAFIQAQGIALDDPISDEAWDEANCVAFWDALRGRGFIV
jgi:hypothetical protein